MFKSDMFCVGCPNGLLAAAEAGVREEDGAECQDGRAPQGQEEEEEEGLTHGGKPHNGLVLIGCYDEQYCFPWSL